MAQMCERCKTAILVNLETQNRDRYQSIYFLLMQSINIIEWSNMFATRSSDRKWHTLIYEQIKGKIVFLKVLFMLMVKYTYTEIHCTQSILVKLAVALS